MGGRIIEASRAPEYVPGMANKVISIVDVKIQAVAYGDDESKRHVCLVAIFGTDAEDKEQGVFIMATEEEMNTQLKLAPMIIKKAVRDHLASQEPIEGSEVPESTVALAGTRTQLNDGSIGSIDIGGGK